MIKKKEISYILYSYNIFYIFIKNYDEDGDVGYFLEAYIEYPRE